MKKEKKSIAPVVNTENTQNNLAIVNKFFVRCRLIEFVSVTPSKKFLENNLNEKKTTRTEDEGANKQKMG